MRKLTKILIPIDFSEESARALRCALSLAKETRAELVALHVIEKTDASEGQDNQESKDGQFAQGNDSDDSGKRHRPRSSGAAQVVVSQSGGFETHQTDPRSTLSRAAGSSGRPPSL